MFFVDTIYIILNVNLDLLNRAKTVVMRTSIYSCSIQRVRYAREEILCLP